MTTDTFRTAADGLTPYTTDWVQVAQRLFSFDRETAQRLAFVRWLRTTRRLRGDDAAETALLQATPWMDR